MQLPDREPGFPLSHVKTALNSRMLGRMLQQDARAGCPIAHTAAGWLRGSPGKSFSEALIWVFCCKPSRLFRLPHTTGAHSTARTSYPPHPTPSHAKYIHYISSCRCCSQASYSAPTQTTQGCWTNASWDSAALTNICDFTPTNPSEKSLHNVLHPHRIQQNV